MTPYDYPRREEETIRRFVGGILEYTRRVAESREFSEDDWVRRAHEVVGAPPFLTILLPEEVQQIREAYKRHRRLRKRTKPFGMATMRRVV